jgi:hypothetical protein
MTTVHAAVLGGCAGALPALVGAGVPLDAVMQVCSWLQRFMDGVYSSQRVTGGFKGGTALALAARCVHCALCIVHRALCSSQH